MSTRAEKKMDIGLRILVGGSTLLGAGIGGAQGITPHVWTGVVVGGVAGLCLSVLSAVFILFVLDLAVDIRSLYKEGE